jgi:dihydroxyacetone kinase DhaKLM complex PTS-EIIA-like component DhaM
VTEQVTPADATEAKGATPLDPGDAVVPGSAPAADPVPAVALAEEEPAEEPAALRIEEPAEEPVEESAAVDQTAPEAAPGTNRSRLGKLIGIGVLALALTLVATAAYAAVQYLSGGVDDAKVGDCITGVSAPKEGAESEAGKAKLVDCGSASTNFKVAARFEKKKLSEADAACQAYPDAPFVFTAIPDGGTGVVLCLSKV